MYTYRKEESIGIMLIISFIQLSTYLSREREGGSVRVENMELEKQLEQNDDRKKIVRN